MNRYKSSSGVFGCILLRKETKILDFRVVNQDVKRKCFDKGRIVDALGKPEGYAAMLAQ